MENIIIPETSCTPFIDFRFDSHYFFLSGESYPENASEFYTPLISKIQEYLQSLSVGTEMRQSETLLPSIEIHVSLRYFNSSSTKVLFRLFELFNEVITQVASITLHWYFDKEDDIGQEFGEHLQVYFPDMSYQYITLSDNNDF